MKTHILAAAVLPLLLLPGCASQEEQMTTTTALPDARTSLSYPDTRRVDLVENKFGVEVADPYRWLENDVREDKDVANWVAAENAVTDAYLATLPGRDIFAKRLRALIDFERFSAPQVESGRFAYEYNSGLMNQSVLMVRDGRSGEGRVVIDPNAWSADNTIALGGWDMSPDGRRIAYMEQDGGSDWRTIKVFDLETGETLSDTIEWAKFTGLDWDGHSEGFFYSRFPEPEEGQTFQALNLNQALYYHRLGSGQAEDRKVFDTPDQPKLGHTAEVSADGRYLVIYSTEGTDERVDVHVVDLTSADWTPRPLVMGRANNWDLIGAEGDRLFFRTNLDAPRERFVTMDLSQANPEPVEIVPQSRDVLEDAVLQDGLIAATYMADVKSEVRLFAPDGASRGTLALPGIGSAGVSHGEAGELYYTYTSFTQPPAVYRYDIASGASTAWATPKLNFDPDAYSAQQVFYPSKDGTKIPMFIVHRKDVDIASPRPTILYGYGGFNISLLPGYSTTRLAWLEQGGVFAVANLRGGGEYGKEWHDGGRLANKQNVFDDFIAAAEYLQEIGVTSPQKLVIQGGSNGGLLVGAVTNQRPDLFAAALPAVGVMDMVRFDQFTAGRYWVDDYGYPDREADFRALYKYSPYHNIRSGEDYPAVLVTTADTDDRVVPGHSFKYAAALQAADVGDAPHLIRIETRAGHGSGKPVDKIIEEYSDVWAFAAAQTGLKVTEK